MENKTLYPLCSDKVMLMLSETLQRKPSTCCTLFNYIIQNFDNDFMPYHNEVRNVKSISMLSFRKDGDDFVISYLPIGKEPEYTEKGKWARKNRQQGKIGKVFKTFITPYLKVIGANEPTPSEIEEFVNDVKHFLGHSCYEFALVKGEDIRKYYHHENYFMTSNGGSTLFCSCMKYDKCQTFFDIYEYNPDCELLIMFDKTLSSTKIVGRALVWNKNGVKYVDRRYYCLDQYHTSMINYIEDQKWFYKASNTFDDDESMKFMGPNENGDYELHSDIELTYIYKDCIEEFPYADTIKFWNPYSFKLTNIPFREGFDCKLDCTDGTMSHEYDEDYVECTYCGNRIHIDDACYIEDYGDVCSHHCVSDYLGENIIEACAVRVYNANGYSDYVHENEVEDIAMLYEGKWYYLPENTRYSIFVDVSEISEEDKDEYVIVNEDYAVRI